MGLYAIAIAIFAGFCVSVFFSGRREKRFYEKYAKSVDEVAELVAIRRTEARNHILATPKNERMAKRDQYTWDYLSEKIGDEGKLLELFALCEWRNLINLASDYEARGDITKEIKGLLGAVEELKGEIDG
jgi:hypothetical protein